MYCSKWHKHAHLMISLLFSLIDVTWSVWGYKLEYKFVCLLCSDHSHLQIGEDCSVNFVYLWNDAVAQPLPCELYPACVSAPCGPSVIHSGSVELPFYTSTCQEHCLKLPKCTTDSVFPGSIGLFCACGELYSVFGSLGVWSA